MANASAGGRGRSFLRYVWPALFAVTWVLLGLEAFEYLWGGLWFGVLLMLFFFRLVQLVVAVMVGRRDALPGAALWLATTIAVFVTHAVCVEGQMRVTQERGDEIAEALEAYYDQHRAYPLALRDLVPEAVHSLPASGMGLWREHGFGYSTSMDDYLLEFATPGFLFCRRGPTTGWSLD